MSIINLAGFDVHLTRKRIKNINLRIDRQGKIKISAPTQCALVEIQQFLHKKQAWITTHQTRIRQQPLPTSLGLSLPLSFKSGEQFLFLGQPYLLRVYESAEHNRIILEGDNLCCYVTSSATQDIKRTLLSEWQKQQMRSLLPILFQKWQDIIGVQANEWRIRAMKTRWGTCHIIKKRIYLNLYLMAYPLVCLEYVIVHELVHLLEASHNQHFYALMSQYMPEWQKYRKLLKHYTYNNPVCPA